MRVGVWETERYGENIKSTALLPASRRDAKWTSGVEIDTAIIWMLGFVDSHGMVCAVRLGSRIVRQRRQMCG